MKSEKKHIIVLVVLHILILLFPLGAKISHHHAVESNCCEHNHATYLIKQFEHCLVCDFEFLPFESSKPSKIQQIIFANYEFLISPGDKPFIELFNYSSLRGPPVA